VARVAHENGDLLAAGHRAGSQGTTMSNTQPSRKKTRVEPREITHHAVCHDCPEEWVGGGKVSYHAEQHALCRGHRTEVARVDE